MRTSIMAQMAGLLGFLLAPLAQATVTAVGGTCATLPANTANFTTTFTAGVPVGSVVLVTLVTTRNAPLGTVLDTRGHNYVGSITRFNDPGLVFNRDSQVLTTIQSGDTITFPFTSIPGGGMEVCSQLFAVNDLVLPAVEEQIGSNGDVSTSITTNLFAPTTSPVSLLHGSAFVIGTPEGVTTDPLYANHQQRCSTGGTGTIVCLFTGTRAVTNTGNFTYNVGIGTSRTWGAVLTTFPQVRPDNVFANGFE